MTDSKHICHSPNYECYRTELQVGDLIYALALPDDPTPTTYMIKTVGMHRNDGQQIAGDPWYIGVNEGDKAVTAASVVGFDCEGNLLRSTTAGTWEIVKGARVTEIQIMDLELGGLQEKKSMHPVSAPVSTIDKLDKPERYGVWS